MGTERTSSGRPGLLGAFSFASGPLAWVYGRGVARRNRAFDAGRGVVTFDRPVISVGNLSVGGTGKTPMVMHLLTLLRSLGRSPCVAMRGYAPSGGESDEAREYRDAFPDVTVVARADRVGGLLELFAAEAGRKIDAVVLDDGFQHRAIARDLDIVLIDATRPPFGDSLLPKGWLREPPAALARAHAAVITHAESVPAPTVNDIRVKALAVNPSLVVDVARHAWSGFRTRGGGEDRDLPPNAVAGKRVAAACAIGNPQPFFQMVAHAARTAPQPAIALRDHDPYDDDTVAALIKRVRAVAPHALIVTEKDWVKLRRVKDDAWGCPVLRPRLAMTFDGGGAALARAIEDTLARHAAASAADEADTDDAADGDE